MSECANSTGARSVGRGWNMAKPILLSLLRRRVVPHGRLMVVDCGYSVGLPAPGVLDEPLVPGGVRQSSAPQEAKL